MFGFFVTVAFHAFVGRGITSVTLLSFPQAKTGKHLLKSPLLLTRKQVMKLLSCNQPIPSGWAWPLTFLCFTMRF